MSRRFIYREHRVNGRGRIERQYLTERHEWTTDAGRRKYWPEYKAEALRKDLAAAGARVGIVP